MDVRRRRRRHKNAKRRLLEAKAGQDEKILFDHESDSLITF